LSGKHSDHPFKPDSDHPASAGPETAHPHFDNFKFADDAHPGKVPHDPPTALSSDVSGEHPAHPFKPDSDHPASADPEIGDIAKDHPPQHSPDNLPQVPAQHGEDGSPAVTGGTPHPHFDNFKFADDDSPGNVPHDSGHPFKTSLDDMPEIDHPIIAEMQHLLDIAHGANAESAVNPHDPVAPQDAAKAPLPPQHDAFHLV
jgi:hypothetical protein